MPKLLLNLRHVPDDEAEEVRSLMAEHGINCYDTPPGPLAITAGGIWLRDPQDYQRAKALMDDYQAERTRRVRAEYEQAQRQGRVETFRSMIGRHPLRTLAYTALSVFILMIFFAPLVVLWRMT